MDEFSYCLLDPLKSDMEARHVFGCSLDDLMAAGIDWEQKKVQVSEIIQVQSVTTHHTCSV